MIESPSGRMPEKAPRWDLMGTEDCGGGDRGKGVPSFDEMVAIVLEEVDFDDPTTNVRGRRTLAIAKATPRGY